MLNENDKSAINGSLIDIDVSTSSNSMLLSIEDYKNLLCTFHEYEKIIFFKILKSEFLNSLSPEY